VVRDSAEERVTAIGEALRDSVLEGYAGRTKARLGNGVTAARYRKDFDGVS